jgi:hypothetical protein
MNEKMIERVRALLRLAGNNPEPEEAAAAAAKAQEMMLKHSITLAQIADVEGMESAISADQAKMYMQVGKSQANWRAYLGHCVALAHGGTSVVHYDSGTKKYGSYRDGYLHIFAEKDTLPGLLETIKILILQIELGAATATANRPNKGVNARTYKAQWVTGATDVVVRRVNEMHRQVKNESSENSNALVRISNASEDLRNEHYPRLGRGRSARANRYGPGYNDGKEAGRSMSLGGAKVSPGGRMRLTA